MSARLARLQQPKALRRSTRKSARNLAPGRSERSAASPPDSATFVAHCIGLPKSDPIGTRNNSQLRHRGKTIVNPDLMKKI